MVIARDDEKPLDPAFLRIQARMRRLMLIAGLTLGLGIVAVLVAVVYRMFAALPAAVPQVPAVSSARLTLSDLQLPPDARLISSASDGTRLVLTYSYAGGSTLIFVDARRLTVTGRLELPAAP